VFGCAHAGCGQKNDAWRAFFSLDPKTKGASVQLPHDKHYRDEAASSQASGGGDEISGTAPAPIHWGFDASVAAHSGGQEDAAHALDDLSAAFEQLVRKLC
jgi:hypothetical protein